MCLLTVYTEMQSNISPDEKMLVDKMFLTIKLRNEYPHFMYLFIIQLLHAHLLNMSVAYLHITKRI